MISEIIEYNFNEDELEEKLLPLLREKVFHITPYKAFLGIKKDGMIKSNIKNKYEYTFLQSINSYCRKKGGVSLFNLRNKTNSIIDDVLNRRFYFLGHHKFGKKIVFLILKSDFHSDLIVIDSKQMYNDDCKDMYIPKIEEIIIVNITRNSSDNMLTKEEGIGDIHTV